MADRTRDDYDSAWKEALVRYLPDFLELLFPHIHCDIDWTREPRFLDKELQSVAPPRHGKGGGRRVVDALVELHRWGAPSLWVLLHIEVQAQKDREFARRVYQCNARLCDHYYPQPICSLVVLADKSPGWRPKKYETTLWGCRTTFRFPTVKLLDLMPRLDQLESSTNPFALLVAGTLHVQRTRPSSPERWTKKFSLLKNLYLAGFTGDQIREFFYVVDRIMKLTPDFEKLVQRELEKLEQELGVTYISSIERIGMEKGLREGLEQGLEEGREKGLEEGRERGLEEGRERGLEEGRERGLKQGLKQGLEQGLEQGLARGREQTLQGMVRRLSQKGLPREEILEITGLTDQELAALEASA